jgi:molecular chaperone DnaK
MMRFSQTVIVADIGGHGTEVALVTGGENRVGRLVATSGTDDLGAATLDRALAGHVLEQVRGDLAASDLHDPANWATVRDVVVTCQRAREDLVRNTSTVVDVRLPAHSVRVRVVRAEFESSAHEPIRVGLSTIAHVMDHARENGTEADAIVLTGEVTQTPLLTEVISAQWPTRVVIPPRPEWATASGTVHIATHRSQHRLITPLRPTHPTVSNPHQPRPVHNRTDGPPPPRRTPKTPATPSQNMPSVPHVRSTGSKRKWSLKWGAASRQAPAHRDPRHTPRHRYPTPPRRGDPIAYLV